MQGLIPGRERYPSLLSLGGGRPGSRFRKKGLDHGNKQIGKNPRNTFHSRYARLEQGKGFNAYNLAFEIHSCNILVKFSDCYEMISYYN